MMNAHKMKSAGRSASASAAPHTAAASGADEAGAIVEAFCAQLPDPAAPFALLVRFRSQPGSERSVVAAFARARTATLTEPGCRIFELNHHAQRPSRFEVYEQWRSISDFAAHVRTPHFSALRAEREEMTMNAMNLIRRSTIVSAAMLLGTSHAFGTAPSTERALRVSVTVNAPVEEVWDVWSSSTGVQTFLAEKANVDTRIGGPYEIFFNPADERMSTKGCKVLSYVPREMISFEWSLPADMFPDFPKAATWVVVQMHPATNNRTDVTITQLGWGTGPVWDRAYRHMQQGWTELAERLKRRFVQGPVDWQTQNMMWQERVGK